MTFVIWIIIGVILSAAMAAGLVILNDKRLGIKNNQTLAISSKTNVKDLLVKDPLAYFSLIKDSLPRDKGLIYSVEMAVFDEKRRMGFEVKNLNWKLGDNIIIIEVKDGITEKSIETFAHNESMITDDRYYMTVGEAREKIITRVNKIVAENERTKLIGHKEIVY